MVLKKECLICKTQFRKDHGSDTCSDDCHSKYQYRRSSVKTIFSCGEMGEGKSLGYFSEHLYDEGSYL